MITSRQAKQKTGALEHGSNQKLAKILYALVLVILVIMPFHGFITTWAGSVFGNLLLWRAWKEVLLIPASLIGLTLVIKDRSLRNELFVNRRRLILLIIVFALWNVINTVFGGENTTAAVLGLAIHTRWVVVFALAMIASYYVPVSRNQMVKFILIPAAVVIGLGVLQMFVLPYDFLKYFGYQKNVTIPPFFTIDEQLSRLRIASTLRGPNPLGVYLLLPLMTLIAFGPTFWRKLKYAKNRSVIIKSLATVALFIGALAVMYGSHSRGAWLGLIAAVASFVLIKLPNKMRLFIATTGVIFLVIGVVGIYQYRNTSFVQHVILHDNPEEGGAVSSNEGHVDSLKSGLDNIAESPLVGCGVGCAGPASAHNTKGAQLSENYFIQTAEESGIISLLLLLAIFVYVARLLIQRSVDPLAVVLLASFVGIGIAALTAHAWTDDTISYLWWGILGLFLYNNHQGKQNDKEKTKSKTAQKASS